MGSKRYTMEPTITVNVFWAENENNSLTMHSFCLGTKSFALPPEVALSEKEQKAYNKAMMNYEKQLQEENSQDSNVAQENDDESESSSTWDDIEEV